MFVEEVVYIMPVFPSCWVGDPTAILHDFVRASYLDGVSDSETFVVDFHRQWDSYRSTFVFIITVYFTLSDKFECYKCWYNFSGEFVSKRSW